MCSTPAAEYAGSVLLHAEQHWSLQQVSCLYPRAISSQSPLPVAVQVDDPSKYGVVVIDEYGQVQRFVEKPKVCRGSEGLS